MPPSLLFMMSVLSFSASLATHQVLLFFFAFIKQILIHAKLAAPWVGVNALDALVQVWNGISMMRQQLMPTDRVHGIVTDGGQAVSYNYIQKRMRVTDRHTFFFFLP